MTGINRRDKKTKIQQRGDMSNTKLHELLENIFTNRRMSGNKHIGYFYEKENFMANSMLKLR